jgi:hypothetical protein
MQHQEMLLADVQWHNLSRQLETEQENERLALDQNRQMLERLAK